MVYVKNLRLSDFGIAVSAFRAELNNIEINIQGQSLAHSYRTMSSRQAAVGKENMAEHPLMREHCSSVITMLPQDAGKRILSEVMSSPFCSCSSVLLRSYLVRFMPLYIPHQVVSTWLFYMKRTVLGTKQLLNKYFLTKQIISNMHNNIRRQILLYLCHRLGTHFPKSIVFDECLRYSSYISMILCQKLIHSKLEQKRERLSNKTKWVVGHIYLIRNIYKF